jgi:hypothetical protein
MVRNRIVLLAMFFLPLLMQPQTSRPLWEIDLSKFGYQGRPPSALQHLPPSLGPLAGWAWQQGVAFTDPNTVVAYFVVHDDPHEAAGHRDASLSDPFRLVAVFLNANDGALIGHLDWPLPSDPQAVPPSFLIPAAKGQFVVGLGSKLDLYSSDLKLLRHLDVESELSPIVSPSGESVLLHTGNRVDGQRVTQYQLLDTRNLSVLKSWSEPEGTPPHEVEALWGDELAWTARSSLYFTSSSVPPKEVLANHGELCGSWSFINRQDLAGPTCGDANKVLIVSTDGKIISSFDLGFEQIDGPIVASANGRRFAVPTMRWGTGQNNEPDQIAARVFSTESATPLMTLSVPRSSGWGRGYFYASYGDTRFGWGGLALSPDGGLVAVKSEADVRVYRVPETGSSNQCVANCPNQANPVSPRPALPELAGVGSPSSQLVGQMLTWFPADTETVTAVMGPFLLPQMEKDSNGGLTMAKSGDEVRDRFMQSPLLLLFGKDGLLAKALKDKSVVAAIEGSRDFQAPTGLGGMRYQGGAIAVFAGDITATANAFLKDSAPVVMRKEQVEGHEVAVFQEKSEEDLWTTYVAFPKPNIAVVATSEDYLREVLARINGKTGERALPANLPEWKYVNTHAEFWAVRHYQKTGAATDPSSPFNRGWGKTPDPQAIGLTFSFDPARSKTAILTNLSGDENSLQRLQRGSFTEHGPAVMQMHIRYQEVEPGILEGSYEVGQLESADTFIFVLEALLGHGVYV